jgi:hypothetical protein
MQRLLDLYRVTSSAVALVLLIVFNLLPLVGVALWGWDLWSILTLYWVENGIVGVLNVMKILRAQGSGQGFSATLNGQPMHLVPRAALASFFTIHYGFFWLGHGVFVLFALPLIAAASSGGLGLDVVWPDWGLVALGAVGLGISHGASFWLNFIGRSEYRVVSPGQLFLAPYGRLVVLHVTIIFGAMVSTWIGSPIGALLVLIALKTALDAYFHLREHRRIATGEPGGSVREQPAA